MSGELYIIRTDDSDIEAAAEAMADDYEVSREVMRMALQAFVITHIEHWMEELREWAIRDEYFDRRFVENAKRDWQRANPFRDTKE